MVMKDIQERAESYAAEKMNDLMNRAIAQAYSDGYRDGYKDWGVDSVKLDSVEGVICVHDLGLPSGTMWTLNYMEDEEGGISYLPYVKAVTLGLPSKEQVDELIENCRWQGEFSSTGMSFYGAICIGANGDKISFNSCGYKEDEKKVGAPYYGGGSAYFWIHDEEEGDEKSAVRIYSMENGKPKLEIVKIFSGYKFPVLIVRKRNQ